MTESHPTSQDLIPSMTHSGRTNYRWKLTTCDMCSWSHQSHLSEETNQALRLGLAWFGWCCLDWNEFGIPFVKCPTPIPIVWLVESTVQWCSRVLILSGPTTPPMTATHEFHRPASHAFTHPASTEPRGAGLTARTRVPAAGVFSLRPSHTHENGRTWWDTPRLEGTQGEFGPHPDECPFRSFPSLVSRGD